VDLVRDLSHVVTSPNLADDALAEKQEKKGKKGARHALPP